MDILHVVILSIVEGVTEFLPISSTGHLILTSKLLGITTTEFTKTFEIAIQLGAILSIVVLYFKRFFTDIDMYKKLIVAFLPTAVVGVILYPIIKGFLLGSSMVTLTSLFVGGLVLIFFKNEKKGTELGLRGAFLIGVFQSVSVVPGVSRAAATIVGGLLVGLNRKEATEFSFLLAVPTMFAATGYDLYRSMGILNYENVIILGIGFILSFIFATLAVKLLISYVQNHDFKVFGIYRVLLALAFWFFMKN